MPSSPPGRKYRLVSRTWIFPLLFVLVMEPQARSQGIAGVTRPVTALERQLPARQFFGAAGLNLAGNGATLATPPAASTAVPVIVPSRPYAARPLLVQRPANGLSQPVTSTARGVAWSPVVRIPPPAQRPMLSGRPQPVGAARTLPIAPTLKVSRKAPIRPAAVPVPSTLDPVPTPGKPRDVHP